MTTDENNIALTVSILLGGALLVLFQVFPEVVLPSVDLMQYWCAAKLFLSHQNPYDEALMTALQIPFKDYKGAILMWNPPLIFPLIIPFAFFSFESLKGIWCAISFGLVFWCIIKLIIFYRTQDFDFNKRALLWILLITFPAIFDSIVYGQISVILMLGITGFWIYYTRSGLSSFYAGLFLGLTLIKPHLLLPFYCYLGVRSIIQREFRCLLGIATLASVFAIITAFVDINVFQYYAQAMKSPPIYWRTPNIGSLLQAATEIHSVSIRFAPMIISTVLLTFVLLKNSKTLFKKEFEYALMALLVVLSLLVSPYGWIYDQLVLLPLVFQVAVQVWFNDLVSAKERMAQFLFLLIGHAFPFYLPADWGQERGIVILIFYSIVLFRNFSLQFMKFEKRV